MNILTKVNRKVIIASVAAVLIVAIVAFIFTRSAGPAMLDSDVPGVADSKFDVEDLLLSGNLVFPNTLELSFSSEGEVGSVNVSEADRVSKGDILATLDNV
ncbi:MAG: hypothetical protein CL886_05940, partial [Dehalococcoidia bacterium]|nr:hypothetical protein [Dehalococcoidia bacterium]